MGIAPERVFKTLVADVDGALTVAVVPVAGSLDLKALAAAAGGKRAAMADPAAAERTTGYVLRRHLPAGPAQAAAHGGRRLGAGHPTVFVSAGRRGLEVELAAADLVRAHRRDDRADRPRLTPPAQRVGGQVAVPVPARSRGPSAGGVGGCGGYAGTGAAAGRRGAARIVPAGPLGPGAQRGPG